MADRQTDNRRQTDDRQTENSNPSVAYDTFACFAGLINCQWKLKTGKTLTSLGKD